MGRASLLAHCSRCAVGLCPMGSLQSPWADTSQKDFAGFAWTVGTVLGHYVCSHLLGWDTSQCPWSRNFSWQRLKEGLGRRAEHWPLLELDFTSSFGPAQRVHGPTS